MSISITRTKLVVPSRRADLVSRPRLLDLFHPLLDSKLFLVTAQAGSGKTSLLIDLAHSIDIPICWYSLDVLDRDPQRFLGHLIETISLKFPQYGKQSKAALNVPGGDLNIQSITATIINEIFESVDEHFVIVLDDYHLVEDVGLIEQFMNRFIFDMHENIHVVLASRNLVSFPDITLWAARGQYHGLDFSELAFSPEEVQAMLQNTHGVHLPLESAEQLVRENDGWITGLLLSAETVWQRLTNLEKPSRPPGIDLYTYLADQVLDQQSPEIRRFLLLSSLFEEFNSALCESVLGSPQDGESWQNLINIIVKKNLFLTTVGEDGQWLRYHHLFRDFLQARLREEDPDIIAPLYLKLAEEHTKNQEWEKAHAIYQHQGDQDKIAKFIIKAAQTLWDAGRLLLLEEWFNGLSLESLHANPILLGFKASITCARGNYQLGMEYYSQAEKILAGGDDPISLAQMLAHRASWQYAGGYHKEAINDADRVFELIKNKKKIKHILAEAFKAKGASLARLGDLANGEIYVEKAFAIYETLERPAELAKCCIILGMIYRAGGNYNAALKIYDRSLNLFEEVGDLSSFAIQHNNIGVLHHFLGDFDRAKRSIEKALQLAKQTGRPQLEAFALSSLGDIYLDLEAADSAGEAFLQASEIIRRYPDRFFGYYAILGMAKAYRIKGKLGKSRKELEGLINEAGPERSAYEKGLLAQELGHLALQENDHEKAISNMAEAAKFFMESGQKSESAKAYFMLAYMRLLNKSEKNAMLDLKEAFRLAAELGNPFTLVIPGRDGRTLVEKANDIPDLRDQAQGLLSNIQRFDQNYPELRRSIRRQPSLIPFQAPRLTIYTFGHGQVFKDGRPITDPEWCSRKNVRDLFFLLLTHPEGQKKEKIGLVFWPDASPSQLKINFKNAVYRLRRALGQEVVLYHDNFYIFNPDVDYQYDVEEFRQLVAQAKQSRSVVEKIAAYKNAVEIYRGPFLEDMDQSWIEPHRENYRQIYIRAVMDLSEQLISLNRPEEVLYYCWRLVSAFPLIEEPYILIMQAHAMLGNRHEIENAYNRIKTSLSEELGISPSEKTTKLYESLRK